MMMIIIVMKIIIIIFNELLYINILIIYICIK